MKIRVGLKLDEEILSTLRLLQADFKVQKPSEDEFSISTIANAILLKALENYTRNKEIIIKLGRLCN